MASGGRDGMVAGKHRRGKTARWLQARLRGAGALLLAVSACIHLDLYLTGYRSIPTIGWLFLAQALVASVLTVAVLVTRGWLAAAASAGFALSTLSAYLVAIWIGLFGFKEIRTRAGIAAGLIEVAAFGVLALAAMAAGHMRQGDAQGQGDDQVGPTSRLRRRLQVAVSTVTALVGAASLAALALLGVAEASAAAPSAVAVGVRVTLKAARIGGVTVLTNAKGRTLYWFAPDTSATSKCTGSCAAYWPPVTGDPEAGPGVPGKLGTITRPGGDAQVTYNGHPLYTYIGDGPG